MHKTPILVTLATLLGAGTAQAQDLRPLCADRPGLGTPACTVDPGHVVAELGTLDWSRDQDLATRSDSWTAGDLLVRLGVTDTLEVQAGWTAFGAVRSQDRATGASTTTRGTGDVTLAVRRNLSHPDGSGFSAAVMPFVTLPTGGNTIGAGDWGAGMIVPLSYSLNDVLAVALTPEADAAVDGDRRGRHLAYGSVIGLSAAISPKVSSTIEFQAVRDNDPAGHATQALASLSLAWQPKDRLQLDAGAVAGLNRASPDAELYVGIARRF
ncbi:MAG: transporter [Sphingomonas sp.]